MGVIPGDSPGGADVRSVCLGTFVDCVLGLDSWEAEGWF